MCAPPTVWRMLIQEDLTRWPVALRECVAAGEGLYDVQVPLRESIVHTRSLAKA